MSADLRAAAQQALEALTAHENLLGTRYLKMDAITALRAALAQQAEPVQEPVAWIDIDDLEKMRKHGRGCIAWGRQQVNAKMPLYLAPPSVQQSR